MTLETTAPAVAAGESNVATTTAGPAADTHRDIESLAPGSKEYTEWRKSGKLPTTLKETPASAASATATEEDEEETAEHEAPPSSTAATAADSQTAPRTEGKKAKQRYHELVDLIRTKDAEIERLRQPPIKETPAEKPHSQAATADATETQANLEPKMEDVDPKTGKPKFGTYGDWQTARDKWLENKLLSTLEQKSEQRQKEKMSADQAREVTDAYRNRVEKAREKYKDFDAVAFSDKLPVPANSPMEASIVLSEHGPEMSYLLGKNPVEAERISKLPPFQQAREMFLLELLAGGWDGLAKDQRFAPKLSSSVKPKKITAVTSIPHEVGGSGTVLPDEVEQAANESEDDPQAVRRFIEADTRRAISRRKGK